MIVERTDTLNFERIVGLETTKPLNEKMVRILNRMREDESSQVFGMLIKLSATCGAQYCALGYIGNEMMQESGRAAAIFHGMPGKALFDYTGSKEFCEETGLAQTLTENDTVYLREIGPSLLWTQDTSRFGALILLNDKLRMSFGEIVDVIEDLGWNRKEVSC